jgi:glycine hydroxymethyltransferase
MISTTLLGLEQKELDRQQNSLELIASENYVSPDVISAYSNVFTNKYSE